MRTQLYLGRTIGILIAILAPAASFSRAANAANEAPDADSTAAAQQAKSPEAEASPASAAEATPTEGKIAIAVPEAMPPVARSYHMHDGFYARAVAGIGWVGSDWAPKGDVSPSIDAGGTALSLDLLVGGSPSRGVAVGGALLTHLMLSTDITAGGQDFSSGDMNLFLLGPFIDGFPSPSQGWHLGGTVGLVRAELETTESLDTWGLGGAAWAGYDAWVGDEWSVGGLARFMLTRTSGEDSTATDVSATATTFTLSFTALFH